MMTHQNYFVSSGFLSHTTQTSVAGAIRQVDSTNNRWLSSVQTNPEEETHTYYHQKEVVRHKKYLALLQILEDICASSGSPFMHPDLPFPPTSMAPVLDPQQTPHTTASVTFRL